MKSFEGKTTRRNALTLGTAGALATALRPLSAVAAAGEKDAADHGEFPESVFNQMNLRRIRVEIGLSKAFSVVQASDSHLTSVSAADFEKLDDKSMEWYLSRSKIFAGGIPGLAAALFYAKKKEIPLFHTGDLFDFPSYGNLDMVRRDFAGRDWFFAPGNHEYHGWGPGAPAIRFGRGAEDRAAGRRLMEPHFPNPFPVASRIIGGVNFVQYDNGGFSDYTGQWQLERVKKEFAKGLPVVMLCHMPFYTEELVEQMVAKKKLVKDQINAGYLQGVPWCNNWSGRVDMMNWLKTQPLLKAVICGHLHNEFIVDFAPGVKQYVADANYKGAVYEFTFA